MSSKTLTSLAMLKVNIDLGRDYLDYLRPFIMQVLRDHKPEPVNDVAVQEHIRNDFGLEIPDRTVQIVLKRLSRQYPLTREHGVYRITGDLPNPGIAAERATANRHIQSVVAGLKEFSKDTARPITSDDDTIRAICGFLAEFNIPCLRAYLRGTVIPTIEKHDNALIVLVSKYVLSLQETEPERFESFLVVVKGHMLANALLCPDLEQAPKTYRGVTFYFDTPLLIRRLGLEGQAKQAAVENLITLLRNLGARVAAFSHSRDEFERVIRGASNWINSPDGRGSIVMEARKTNITKSDLRMLADEVDDKLSTVGINVLATPPYVKDFQINEKAFEGVLEDEVWYHNPRAQEDDINSVRSIYVLRSGNSPRNVEQAKAVLVSSNSGFAKAAFEYGKHYEELRQVSSVITDFSLANMAWLKSPLDAPALPMTEVIAFSYAALQPPKQLLEKYIGEIDKLEKRGNFTARNHQLLRSSDLAQQELMNLTLGEDDEFTDRTVPELLDRVTAEIKKSENEKYQAEQAVHHQTQQKLAAEQAKNQHVQKELYRRCYRKAAGCAWVVSVIFGILLSIGLTRSILVIDSPIGSLSLVVLIFMTLLSLFFGTHIKKLHSWVHDKCLAWFLRREAVLTDLDFERMR